MTVASKCTKSSGELLMGLERFQQRVTSPDELTTLIGSPSDLVIRKQLSQLDAHMKSFVAQSPFLLLGTVGRDGRCDVSPRGDLPAAAKVLDSRTLVVAERSGNRRADSLRNIIETGRVGLLFVIPGIGETLRVNGRACVFRDQDLLSDMCVNDKPPLLGIAVEVEECYLQCAKALLRSKLWDGDQVTRRSSLPCFAKMLIDQTGIDNETVESLQEQIEDSYAHRLH